MFPAIVVDTTAAVRKVQTLKPKKKFYLNKTFFQTYKICHNNITSPWFRRRGGGTNSNRLLFLKSLKCFNKKIIQEKID